MKERKREGSLEGKESNKKSAHLCRFKRETAVFCKILNLQLLFLQIAMVRLSRQSWSNPYLAYLSCIGLPDLPFLGLRV